MQYILTLTPAAQAHFSSLLINEGGGQGMNLRITVTDSGTPKADVGIVFCPAGDEEPEDLAQQYPDFVLYIAQDAKKSLLDAVIDYKTDSLGGQLSVKAPYIKGAAPGKNAPLQQRVQYILDTEINPNLASHGGLVRLVDIVNNTVVVLQFGGGCHGCGMADVTLKNGIEKTLLEKCPDITQVMDATDHSTGENPYYVQ